MDERRDSLSQMRTVQIQLLGAFAVWNAQGALCADLGTDGRRLAAYLFSFPNRVHRRDKLIDLFWPDFAAGQGRALFSTALWKVRRMLGAMARGAAITGSHREVSLQLDDTSLVDAHHFRSATLAAFASQSGTVDFGALDRAVSLYAGPFLEEYDEDWVLDERERLQSLYLRALAHLMNSLAEQRRYDDSLLCGRRILASDPMRESIQRAVMLLYVLNGQRGEALRQFDRCQRVLQVECDVDPMPETRTLMTIIRSGEVFQQLPHLIETVLPSNGRPAPPLSTL